MTCVAFSIKFAKTNQKFAENSEFCEKIHYFSKLFTSLLTERFSPDDVEGFLSKELALAEAPKAPAPCDCGARIAWTSASQPSKLPPGMEENLPDPGSTTEGAPGPTQPPLRARTP